MNKVSERARAVSLHTLRLGADRAPKGSPSRTVLPPTTYRGARRFVCRPEPRFRGPLEERAGKVDISTNVPWLRYVLMVAPCVMPARPRSRM